MIATGQLLPDSLRAGRRLIESLPEVELVSDLTWFEQANAWGLLCRIRIQTADSELVPAKTNWWVLLDKRYPLGRIKFHPAKDGGLTRTFAHQSYNAPGLKSVPWRTGDICNRAPQFAFGRFAYDPDPIGDPNRLGWYLARTIEWLEAASKGELFKPGEYFELPVFLPTSLSFHTLAYSESARSFEQWQLIAEQFGTAEIVSVGSRQADTFAIRRFMDTSGKPLLEVPWGSEIAQSKRVIPNALWVRMNELPVLPPYQAPHSWSELLEVFRNTGTELDGILQKAFDLIRDGNSHFMLLGFPVPQLIGEEPGQMHWQPLLLPVVSHGKHSANGFRPKYGGYWRRDRGQLVRDSDQIQWQASENWDRNETTRRGRLSDALANGQALIIGAGAVGSTCADLLLRAGLHRQIIIDADSLKHGNLCRHVLTVSSIGQSKAQALAEHLNKASAHANVCGIDAKFPELSTHDRQRIEQCDIVLDCTGDDETLIEITHYPWNRKRLFASLSLSYRAKRLYVYTAYGTHFPIDDFRQALQTWLERDAEEFGGEQLVQDGIGCWHAAFPARNDQVSMLVSAAVCHLDDIARRGAVTPQLAVFEQTVTEDGFGGIERKWHAVQSSDAILVGE